MERFPERKERWRKIRHKGQKPFLSLINIPSPMSHQSILNLLSNGGSTDVCSLPTIKDLVWKHEAFDLWCWINLSVFLLPLGFSCLTLDAWAINQAKEDIKGYDTKSIRRSTAKNQKVDRMISISVIENSLLSFMARSLMRDSFDREPIAEKGLCFLSLFLSLYLLFLLSSCLSSLPVPSLGHERRRDEKNDRKVPW